MWAIFLSAIWTIISWIFRQIVIKFCLYVALYLFVTEAVDWLTAKINLGGANFNLALNGLPAATAYFFGLARVDIGFPLALGSLFLRFMIRRIPLIG